jgi:sirohydrochlorin ferrochelatase
MAATTPTGLLLIAHGTREPRGAEEMAEEVARRTTGGRS